MKKGLFHLLRFAIALGLVLFVLSRVDLVDRIRFVGIEGQVLEEHGGEILGEWRSETVRFAHDDVELGERSYRPGPDPVDHARRIEIRPGLMTYVAGMDLWLFLAGASCFFFVAAFSAVRWRWLLSVNDLVVPLGAAFRLTWIGIFFNNVVPGLTGGDVIKAIYVVRLTGEKARPVLSVLVDRVLGLIALAILAAIVVVFEMKAFAAIATGVYIGLILLVLGATVFLSRRVRARLKLDALLKRLPGSGVLMMLDQALHHYRNHLRGMLVWLGLSVANHLVGVIGVLWIGQALHTEIPALHYLILVPIINIASAVPIAPAGWGVGEYLYATLFGGYSAAFVSGVETAAASTQVMATRAIALSIVYRVHLMVWSLLGGVFLAFERGRADVREISAVMGEVGSAAQGPSAEPRIE